MSFLQSFSKFSDHFFDLFFFQLFSLNQEILRTLFFFSVTENGNFKSSTTLAMPKEIRVGGKGGGVPGARRGGWIYL